MNEVHHRQFNDEIRESYEKLLKSNDEFRKALYDELIELRKKIDEHWERHYSDKNCDNCDRRDELELLPNEFLHCVDGVHQLYKKCPNCEYLPLYFEYVINPPSSP